MFQPGKSLDFRNKDVKHIFNNKTKRMTNIQKVTNLIKSKNYTKLFNKYGKPIIDEEENYHEDEETTELESSVTK